MYSNFFIAFYSANNYYDYANNYNMDTYWKYTAGSAAAQLARAKDLLSTGQVQNSQPTTSTQMPMIPGPLDSNGQTTTTVYQSL